MRKTFIVCMLLCLTALGGFAQRITDRLDRGLIAMKVSEGIFLSWRITAEEYYDTEFNIYRDGTKLNAEPLSISNFTDKEGIISSTYTVCAVVGGEEQEPCSAIVPWSNSFKEIKLTHPDIKSRLCPNDATCADVDGDGELEILIKYDNIDEMEQSYPKYGPTIDGVATGEYSIFECLKQDGTRLWWVNCGPNMGDFQNNEQNIMAYDWDGDGRAEAVMRAADGTVVHMSDGTTYTVGDATKNVRGATGGGTSWFVTTDGEYLLYMDGLTGKPYQCIPYPLKRLEQGETDMNRAWGDGYGHRCSKHFVGAPYLDGHKPSIFLARGIYTRHKMIAYDVNPDTHTLIERWHWTCNADGPWKAQGYHNYGVADVDMDGRDEIVFGSMVIDDNGKGLSTTGLGHGDAQHCSDFDPYRHGLEIYACLENSPVWGNNYRDATTSKVYHHHAGNRDDGRSMAGNFTNSYPGAIACSSTEGFISTVTNEAISGLNGGGVHTNFRIYWDGDLCEETFNGVNGKNTEGAIAKYGSWTPIYTCVGSLTNNDTKATPCFQGDILGDWREEIIMRTAANDIRIYSTPTATTWRNYSLWHDHQYRNAMVWQMCGYNQPPHTSYFLGELEDITIAPPPLTTTGRIHVGDGSSIDASLNGQHVLVSENSATSLSIASGAQPSVLTFNVPTWVQGTAPSECTTKDTEINRTTYTCTVTGEGISGNARLVKQGDGTLVLPKSAFTHTGETNVWGGVLCFDGSMKQSPLWLNRHTTLRSDEGQFLSIKADYGSAIEIGGDNKTASHIDVGTLSLGFGSRLVVDLYADDLSADRVNITTLKIERKTGTAWTQGGPAYLMPIIEVVGHLSEGQARMAAGKYVIAHIENIEGTIDDLILEGIETSKKSLYIEDGKLIVEIHSLRNPSTVTWAGTHSGTWDIAETENFTMSGEPTGFVAGDDVVFDDNALHTSITINGDVLPASITVNSSASYTFGGQGAIIGTSIFNKEGTSIVTMKGNNSYIGGNHLRGGVTKVSTLSNQYTAVGNLGGITTDGTLFTMENGAVLQTTAAIETGSPMTMIGEGGIFDLADEFKMNASLSGTLLTKRGNGCLFLMKEGSLDRLIMAGGDVAIQDNNAVKNIEIQSGTLWDDKQATTHSIHVPEGKTGTWQLTYTYYTAYANKLTGSGTLTIVPRNTVQRVRLTGNWSQFEGTIRHITRNICLPLDASTGMPKGTLYLADGCTVSNVAKPFAIGKLTGKGQLLQPIANFSNQSDVNGSNTWNVGNSFDTNGDFTFDGTFSDAGGSNKCIFNKVGSCTMTITGKSTHSGATTISEGALHLSSGAALGTGELTISKGARLLGVTSSDVVLTNSKTIVNGTLQAGAKATSSIGVLDFGGKNVTFNKGSIYQLVARRCASAMKNANSNGCAMIDNVGILRMNGTIRVQLASSHSLEAGDSVRIFSAKTVSGTPTFDLPTIEGLEWDTTHWKSGYLYLKTATNIDAIHLPDTPVSVKVYTIGGYLIDTFNCLRGEAESIVASNAAILPGLCILHIRSKKACELIKLIK